jgi:ABC-type transport system involved in cytochrome c biogenesis permease subunit
MNPTLDTPPTGTRVAAAPNPLLAAASVVLKPLASLQLTVVLFALAIVLVFFGTLAQIDNGIWQVVDQYFWSYVVYIKLNLFTEFASVFLPNLKIGSLSGSIPFPAGKTIGGLMLLNLLAAHVVRFKLSWKRTGIIMIHSGVALMLLGEWVTREKAVEQQMVIDAGAGSNFTHSTRLYELALVDVTDQDDQTAAVVPYSFLVGGTTIHNDLLPFDVEVAEIHANSSLAERKSGEQDSEAVGIARRGKIVPRDPVSGTDPNQKIDMPAAYVKLLTKGDGKSIGKFLVSPRLDPQPVEANGRKYELALRMKRYYKPYTLFLTQFRFDRYLGTNTPKNYSSDVVLVDPERGSERSAHISMNDPLRYGGEAYYQSSFDERTEETTILQVVKNPGWLIPYISCIIVGLGMLVHFGITLPKKAASVVRSEIRSQRTKWDRYAPWASLGFVAVVLVGAVAPLFVRPKPTAYDLTAFGGIPVVDSGRVKPLDTRARTTLRIIAAREYLEDAHENKVQAIAWYAGTIARAESAYKLQTVRIDNEQLLNELKLPIREGFRYSIEELERSEQLILSRARGAMEKKERKQPVDQTEQKFVELAERLREYSLLAEQAGPLVIPPATPGGEWQSFRTVYARLVQAAEDAVWAKLKTPPQDTTDWPKDKQALFDSLLRAEVQSKLEEEPALKAWAEMGVFYRNQKPEEFNAAVAKARELAEAAVTPAERTKVAVEAVYNRVGPFFWATGLYVFGFVLSVVAVLGAGWARKSAFLVLAVTFAVHLLAIVARIYIQGRPPVTNLYSSAVFIGCGCVGLGLALERAFKGGYALFAGSLLGFLTCLVAHNLELMEKKDQLEMMQAVLDTNFWLATHVVCITLGYVATAFAGVLGILYVVQAVFFPSFDRDREKTLATLTYVVLCVATLLSFVGTVLGGIWADQSWGRFWGWDPKENGAVLIVLWNSLVLHARWAGLVKARGVAVLTILGNLVVMWSWFGTNQLGKGLHAYGFNSELATWCTVVWGASLAFAAVGLVPRQMWASTKTAAA